jgi:lipopolysaccharide heptosyltransferase II
MNSWAVCKNILCIRLDNMGDLLMSGPAIAALKETFNCSITVLTSSMAKGIAPLMPYIDDVITFDVPWVKSDLTFTTDGFFKIIQKLKEKKFDAAVVFSVFSQNPLPAIMLTWLAEIPRRLAYCRENPYHLLTDWIPEQEPYNMIRHQVKRDLELVQKIGASVQNDSLQLKEMNEHWNSAKRKLEGTGLHLDKPWLVIHPGVSEKKRRYPEERWIEAGKNIISYLGYQILVTGSSNESSLTKNIAFSIGDGCFSCGGLFTLEEFVACIRHASLVVAVNTSTAHIAAATQTKIIVLYALTNPQHSPWKSRGKILPFTIPIELQSRNEILQFVNSVYFNESVPLPTPAEILSAAKALLSDQHSPAIPELVYSSGVSI